MPTQKSRDGNISERYVPCPTSLLGNVYTGPRPCPISVFASLLHTCVISWHFLKWNHLIFLRLFTVSPTTERPKEKQSARTWGTSPFFRGTKTSKKKKKNSSLELTMCTEASYLSFTPKPLLSRHHFCPTRTYPNNRSDFEPNWIRNGQN